MAFSLEHVRDLTGDRKKWLIACFAGFGSLTVWFVLSGWLGVIRAGQVVVTLVVPAIVMVGFWMEARERMAAREVEMGDALELEHVTNRASREFLSNVSHEITPHLELCSLRAEALAVAVDYRHLCPELKVAVPDVMVVTDVHILRQTLHILVGNAVRHGGPRVAIWASSEGGRTQVSVSDDGPGLAPDTEGKVFERHVDLAGRGPHSVVSGLPLARTLGELLGGEMSYRRDSKWAHFSLLLPAEHESRSANRARYELEAGVH